MPHESMDRGEHDTSARIAQSGGSRGRLAGGTPISTIASSDRKRRETGVSQLLRRRTHKLLHLGRKLLHGAMNYCKLLRRATLFSSEKQTCRKGGVQHLTGRELLHNYCATIALRFHRSLPPASQPDLRQPTVCREMSPRATRLESKPADLRRFAVKPGIRWCGLLRK